MSETVYRAVCDEHKEACQVLWVSNYNVGTTAGDKPADRRDLTVSFMNRLCIIITDPGRNGVQPGESLCSPSTAPPRARGAHV